MTDQTREQMEARAREYFVTALPPELYAFVEMDLGRFAKVAAMFALREIEAQDRQEATQCDRHWLSGLKHGWNMGQLNDRAAYIEAQECREREIRASHPNPSPPEGK